MNFIDTLIPQKKEELFKICSHLEGHNDFIDALLIVFPEMRTKFLKKLVEDFIYHGLIDFTYSNLRGLSFHFHKIAIGKFKEGKYSDYFMAIKCSNSLRAICVEISRINGNLIITND